MTKLINDSLRILREQNGLNQKDIASILNITQPNYSRWETNEKVIPLTKLNHLCNYFHLNIDYLFGLDKKKVMQSDNILDKLFVSNLSKILSISFISVTLNTLCPHEIDNILKMFRIKNNLTQKDIANFLNTTQSTIWAYENGKTLILTSFIYQLALKYHFSIDKFLGRH